MANDNEKPLVPEAKMKSIESAVTNEYSSLTKAYYNNYMFIKLGGYKEDTTELFHEAVRDAKNALKKRVKEVGPEMTPKEVEFIDDALEEKAMKKALEEAEKEVNKSKGVSTLAPMLNRAVEIAAARFPKLHVDQPYEGTPLANLGQKIDPSKGRA